MQPYSNFLVCEMKTNHKTRKWGFRYCSLLLWADLSLSGCKTAGSKSTVHYIEFPPVLVLRAKYLPTFFHDQKHFCWTNPAILTDTVSDMVLIFMAFLSSFLRLSHCCHVKSVVTCGGQAWGAALSPGERGILSTHMFITPELRSCWVRSV